MEESECLSEFRIRKQDIPALVDAMQIPEYIFCDQRTKCGKIEALCMLLRQFSYPCRYSDMMHRFARSVPELYDFMYDFHGHKLSQ